MATAAVLAALLAFATARADSAPAPEAESSTLTATDAKARNCFERPASGNAVDSVELTAPGLGYLAAVLDAGGDWDLGIFDAETGRSLGGAASSSADEIAQAYVLEGQRVLVQACRISGDSTDASLTLGIEPIDAEAGSAKQSLVKVQTPRERDRDLLQSLGLDLTEHGGEDFVAVVLHGPADREALEHAGLESEVLIEDLAKDSARNRSADARYSARAQASDFPSGRTTYRTLADYQQELKDLAADNPDLVRPVTLNHETYEGRIVEGIEITTNPNKIRDGKPVFLQMGLHHAREWPSGEHAMEWAYELIQGYRNDDPKLKPLVEGTRTIVVPVVNPDGFNSSRTAGEVNGNGNGQSGDAIVNFATSPGEYRRKNCRFPGTDSGICPTGASPGAAETGVDPNRNYGGYWGGPGASDSPEAADYRGAEPFSEPETQNIRELVSARPVVTVITNHTFSNLVLRPPGIASLGDSPDEDLYRAFGADMTAENGYLNQKGFELYDTSGTTEDWTYTATGGLGFTFEIGCNQGDDGASFDPEADCIGNFHPPFEQAVAEYEGEGPAAQNVGGGGNRAAYLIAQQSTANTERHSVLTGEAPAGAVLKVERSVETPTWEGHSGDVENPGPPFLDDTLRSAMKVPGSGEFDFHINPSTSPFVAQDRGRPQDGGPPQDPVAFSGDNTTTTPPAGCADFETEDPNCWNDHPFEVDPSADNESATIAISWASPVNDWDMKVFRDTDGDGSSEGEPASAQVGQSAQGPTTEESTTIVDPETASGKLEPGKYVVRVVNFAATDPVTAGYSGEIAFAGPEPFQPGTTQSWTLTCSVGDEVRHSEEITIGRGESKQLDLSESCAGPGGPGGGGGPDGDDLRRCSAEEPNVITGTRKGETLRGTSESDGILGRKGGDTLVGLKADDCLYGQGGRDVLRGRSGADSLLGGRGKDAIRGNRDDDDARGGGGRDRIRGAGGADDLAGNRGRDAINGGVGADLLKGGKGRDRLRGGPDDDVLRGGKGRDVLRGGKGRNVFRCGKGRDKVRAAGRNDEIAKSCEKVQRR